MGVLKVLPNGEEAQYDTRINPEIRIPKEATDVHGITDQSVKRAPTFRKLAPSLADFLHDCDLGGYNIVNFDLPMLQSEFRRVAYPFEIRDRSVLDAMAIFVHKEPRDLKAAYRFYCGKELSQTHSALSDARASWEVLREQMKKYQDLPNRPDYLAEFIAERRRTRVLDSAGWFLIRHGQPAFARGRHKGMRLIDVVRSSPEYIEWLLSTGLPEDTLAIVNSVVPQTEK